jgi:hypothetical protein
MKASFRPVLRTAAIYIIAAIGYLLFTFAATADTMFANEYLYKGQRLTASGCHYRLEMAANGNLVIWENQDYNSPRWWSDTAGRGAYAVMQADGNLVIYNWANQPVWATGTQGFWWSRLDMQNDGNLVVYNGSDLPFFPRDIPIWASNTNGESLGVSSCQTPTNVTVVENDRNRFGGDYKVIDLDRNWPEACEYYCAQDASCRAFTHVPAGIQGPNAKCWLKNTVPPLSYAPGLVSGFIKGR